MQSQISKLEEFGWFLVIVAVSFLIGWFLIGPFATFLSGVNSTSEVNTTPAVPVDLIPQPINNEPILEIEERII